MEFLNRNHILSGIFNISLTITILFCLVTSAKPLNQGICHMKLFTLLFLLCFSVFVANSRPQNHENTKFRTQTPNCNSILLKAG